ncbi:MULTISPECIES: nSTAND1 domain-containing NTPase [Calothrix]|uniref:CHAT domain-containing protein n=2 Tax=Calothrix TaxID=1186 RepID=A0ABR8AGF3_9CYAN|nr:MULTISPECIES: CHAT domain-containing protein [Calothrix]MBD2198383.1 CHAT domain-containing protein [Calothrix parietina FACHB-288]MBD2226708.1 CHAT domain-containing protein [Calothrix anomala FACHB-343]
MKKLVILKFDGNFESGFQVNLEIANEGQRAYRTTTAKLPENITIPQLLNNWHEIYYSRYSQFRIKSGGSRQVDLESLKQECTRESINLLASFNQWLNAQSFISIANSLKEFNPQDEIRIIITTSCHELRQLPWHLWEVLINFPLVEVALSSPNAERRERAYREKIIILIILGDSSNIDIEADKKLLHNFCGDDAEIVLLQQPSREDLNYYLQDEIGWDILFFSGHSRTQNPTPNPLPASEEGAKRMMEGRIYINHHDSLTMGELRDALQVAIQRRLQIAFFNSCDGLGIAYELEQLHIPQVIVMREPVPDKVAQEFLKYFLQEFTSGKSLYISVRNARVELQKLESEFPCASWLPVIIQNQTETPPTWQSLGIISFCPYQGLSAFKEENAEYFFGRNKATASLVTAVNSKPLVAVVGASGSGKSSLVFAGLIPQLRGDTINNWLILSFRPGKNPFAALAVALVSALNLPDNERRLAELELDVNLQRDSTSLERFITSPLTRLLGGEGKRILLIADQFEEIYTLCTDAEERKIFLDGLLQAVNNAPFFTLLLTLRADFLSRALDDYEPFGRALQQYQLEPVVRMNRKELEAAITLPAKQLGFEFEEGLCNTIIDDIEDGDGRLPLLEFTLTQLWKQQYAGRLTHQAYKKIGGVEQALANYAEMVYADLSEWERETAQRVFIQLVQPGEGTEDTRRLATSEEVGGENWDLATSEEVGGENWDLVTRLADKRLVVTNRDELSHEETVEVVHEALIRHWGRLRGWMQENRKFRIWQQGLMVALQQWVESGKDEGALLRGATLAVAEVWLQQRGGEVSKPQRWFIEKSVELRERERKQKQRLQRSVIAGLLCALLVISGFAVFAGWQWREARTLAIKSQNSELVSGSYFAEKLFASNNELEALLEIVKIAKKIKSSAGISKDTIQRVVETLTKVVGSVRERNRLQTDASYAFKFSNAFKEKITTQEKGNIVIINNNYGSIISFSPDGKTIAAVEEQGKIKILGTNGRYLETIKAHNRVTDIHFTPDSKTLVSASNGGIIQFWGKVDKKMHLSKSIKIDIGDTGTEKRLTFSPNGENIISYDNSIIKLWNLNGNLIQTFKRQKITDKISNWKQTIAYDANRNEQKNVWGISSKKKPNYPYLNNVDKETEYFIQAMDWNTIPDNLVSFSTNSKQIAVGNYDGTITLRNLDGTNFRILKGHLGKLQSVIFSPDSKIIASADDEGKIKIWSYQGEEIATLTGHTKSIIDISFSPDGKILASAGNDGTIQLWNNQGNQILTFKSYSASISSINFSPDSKTLASASDNGTIKLWSLDHIDGSRRLWSSENLKEINLKDDNLAYLLKKGCNWLHDYLQNNPDVSAEDRRLCDDIKQKPDFLKKSEF